MGSYYEEENGATYPFKRTLGMSVECHRAVDNMLYSAIINESPTHLVVGFIWPEDASELLDNVSLRLEDAENQVKLVADVFDFVDQ